jgi:hypothetical protein
VGWLALAALGCSHNFDADYAACVDAGRCAVEGPDAGTAPVPDGGYVGCAARGNPENQAFGLGLLDDAGFTMYGCAGSIDNPNRTSLCDSACFSCGADYWLALLPGFPGPRHDYWTNDTLGLASNDGGVCSAAWASAGAPCTEVTVGGDAGQVAPMRICAEVGSACEVRHCGFATATSPDYFGGCGASVLAGALCCCR